MDAKQTYIFLLALAAILLSSCSSDAPGDIVLDEGPELSFDVYNPSRASVSTSLDHFVVYGDINYQADNILAPVKLFDKTLVEYRDGSWCYEGTQHWLPKYEHSFVAISPQSVIHTDNTHRYLNSQLSFTYTLPSDQKDVADILMATHRRLYNDNISSGSNVPTYEATAVTFKFSHLLSLINIAPKLNDEIDPDAYIQFRKLEITGFNSTATFNILPASRQSNSQTDDNVVEVSDLKGSADAYMSIEFTDPQKIYNGVDYVSLFDDNDAIIMLPQAFAADSDAQIILSYTVNEDTSINQVSLPLNNLKWEVGNSYIYKFTILRVGVIFDKCEINPWNVIKGEDITVD